MPDTDSDHESQESIEGTDAEERAQERGQSGGSASGEGAGGDAAASADPLEQARAEAAKLKDQWLRTAADFDNFRKRARREVEDAKKGGREDLLRTVLPVFDNLERAIQSAQRATDVKAVADGLSMVLRQFNDSLGRSGIQKIATVGQAFDPSMHEAIQQVETKEHPAGTVIAEVQPGYMQGERLIRAALVVVARAPAGSENRTPDESGSKN